MISRLTDSEPEPWPTIDPETLVRKATVDESEINDEEPIGYYGAELHPGGFLIFSYRKFGDTFATPPEAVGCDCAGALIETNQHEAHCAVYTTQTQEYADTGLGFLSVDRVVELVSEFQDALRQGVRFSHEERRAWILEQIERS